MTTAKARLASSKTARTQAQERLSLVNEGARTEEVALAKTHIAQSEAALREAKAQRTQLAVKREELAEAQALVRKQEEAKHLAEANRGKVTVSEEEIQALQASVEQATAELTLAEKGPRDCVVAAPLAGTVSRRLVEPGEVIAAGASATSASTGAISGRSTWPSTASAWRHMG